MNPLTLSNLRNFKNCAEMAPEGTYDDAKALNSLIGETVDEFMKNLRSLKLKANNCDLAFDLESAIYNYAQRSNLDNPLFAIAEGFGNHIDGPARERILASIIRDRDFIKNSLK